MSKKIAESAKKKHPLVHWHVSSAIRSLFWSYAILLTVLLLVYNPFAIVPLDEELVEQGFGIHLDPHVAAFILLGVLGLASRYCQDWKMVFLLLLYGGSTEYLQGFTDRCPDWYDVLNNALGILYAWGGWAIVQSFSRNGAFQNHRGCERDVQ